MSKCKKLNFYFRQIILYIRVSTLPKCNLGSEMKELDGTWKASKVLLVLIYNQIYIK